MRPEPAPSTAVRGRTLSKTTIRAAESLGLTQAELAPILGVSTSTVSRLASGALVLSEEQKTWELAALFVRLYRSLDALVGSNESQLRAWLDSANAGLGGVPRNLIARTEGLVRVVQYLDAARGRI